MASKLYNNSHHFDILFSISQLYQQIPIQITFHHIHGHQDKILSYHQLQRPSQLNIMMDTKAKQIATMLIEGELQSYNNTLPFTKCEVFYTDSSHHKVKICSKLTQTLRTHITNKEIRKYWAVKKDLVNKELLIDWDSRKKGLKQLPKHELQWLTKFNTGFCGVGRMLKQINNSMTIVLLLWLRPLDPLNTSSTAALD